MILLCFALVLRLIWYLQWQSVVLWLHSYLFQVLLRSELIKVSSEERSLLKNLGSWLGKLTIGKNQALRAREVDPKSLIIEVGIHSIWWRDVTCIFMIVRVTSDSQHMACILCVGNWAYFVLDGDAGIWEGTDDCRHSFYLQGFIHGQCCKFVHSTTYQQWFLSTPFLFSLRTICLSDNCDSMMCRFSNHVKLVWFTSHQTHGRWRFWDYFVKSTRCQT